MILVAITIDATVHRVSDEYCYLTHQWKRQVKSIEPPRYSIRSNAGGYVELEAGSITFNPDLFVGDWPPPKSCAVTIYITDTTEEAAETMFSGTAHREKIDREGVVYGLYGPAYSSALTSTTYIDGTLLSVFTTYCGASYLNLTLDHTYDRATSPNVYLRAEKDTPVIDMLSALAEAVNHLFYIKGTTLYLVDMLIANGSAIEPEGKFYAPEYADSPAYKRFVTEAVNRYSVAGSYAYGQSEQSDVAGCVEHIYGRIGDNSGNDEAWLVHTDMFPYETDKYYKTMIKYRRTSGSGNLYFGLLGYSADRTTIVDRAGGTNYTLPHWHCVSGGTSATWTTVSGYSRNWSATPTYVAAPNIASPGTLYDDGTDTKADFCRLILLANSDDQAGELDIDFIALYEVDSSGNILEELFYDDFTGGFITLNGYVVKISPYLPGQIYFRPSAYFSPQWLLFSGTGNRETITSVGESETNVEAALANRKAILEKARAVVKMDLTAANMPEPGQQVTVVDDQVNPDGAASVTCTIYARNISFDLDNYKIIVEGEGTIT